MRFGIIMFPGSNCELDCLHVIHNVIMQPAELVWHKEENLKGYDCIILPGGFAHGDYLRAGAIARFSPVMKAVEAFAEEGGLVLGICNGFQILCEAGLLPGALMRNSNLSFICKVLHIKVENASTPFTHLLKKGQVLKVPINHNEGCYYADPETMKRLKDNGQVVFRYCSPQGEVTNAANPNGSLENIAGICNEQRNVLGLMPHPERASEAILGSDDGRAIFESVVSRGGRLWLP